MGLDNPLHIAFLLVILLLVFGAKRLPEIGRSLGEGMRGFKSSIEGVSTSAGISAAAATPAPGVPQPQQAEAVPVAPPLHTEPTSLTHA
jgi:sec-independent protein translocase protein TatA